MTWEVIAVVGWVKHTGAMDATENARRVAERYSHAWLANDRAEIVACYGDDFTLHYFGDNPFSGRHVGRDAAIEMLLAVMAKAPRELLDLSRRGRRRNCQHHSRP